MKKPLPKNLKGKEVRVQFKDTTWAGILVRLTHHYLYIKASFQTFGNKNKNCLVVIPNGKWERLVLADLSGEEFDNI